MRLNDFINWFEDVRVGTRRLISMMPEDSFEFRLHSDSQTMLELAQVFAKLEKQFVKGVCTGDWTDPNHPTDIRSQQFRAYEEETDDFLDETFAIESPDTIDEILDHLDNIHQEALDIFAEISDEEFLTLRVAVPWGEEGTIQRLLIGMVEREIHHRSELYFALRGYGVPVSEMIIWGP